MSQSLKVYKSSFGVKDLDTPRAQSNWGNVEILTSLDMQKRLRSIPILKELHVLYEKEDGVFYATCLDWMLTSQGTSIDAARVALAEAIQVQVDAYGSGLADSIGFSAPKDLWKAFDEGRKLSYPGGLDTYSMKVLESCRKES